MLNYKEYGEGFPVIILHGLLGMLDNWHSFARKLSEDYRVISIDQRNHGKSFHSEEFSYSLLSQDLNDLLESMQIEHCHLIGHSMGGKTVMQFQQDYPEKIYKSVIVDIAPKEYSGGHEKIFETLLQLDLNTVVSRKDAAQKVNEKLQDQNVTLFLLKNLTRAEDNSFRWKANISALWENYAHIKSGVLSDQEILTNTLFVKGSKSNYITNEDIEKIRKIYKKVEIETIESGHWIHAERPNELLNLVLEFLSES